MEDLTKSSLTLESAMDNYRKTCFVLRSNVLETPVDLGSNNDKESLRVSHASDVVMSVDGHHVGVNVESTQMTSSESTPSQVTSSSIGSACDIALSFADSDKKSAIILKQLLLEKMPSLKISEPMAGDFSRVQSLDLARLIVPLLSPAFLASSELVEELNIAVFRNRGSSRRILFPIQISAIPPKPAYMHLIPCEFSSSDYRWASKIVDRNLNDEVFRRSIGMDVDEVFCLKAAADVISQRLSDESTSKQDLDLVNRVLLNVHETEECWRKVRQALYEEEGLEAWKRAFGIEIKSLEDDSKPSRIIQQDEGALDDDTAEPVSRDMESEPSKVQKSVRFEGEGTDDGVELDLNVISDDGQEAAAVTTDQRQSHESGGDHSRSPSTPGRAGAADVNRNNEDGAGRGRKKNESNACVVL